MGTQVGYGVCTFHVDDNLSLLSVMAHKKVKVLIAVIIIPMCF